MSVIPQIGSNTSSHKVDCLCQYLCDKPNGIEFCHLVGEEWPACPYQNEWYKLYMEPSQVACEDMCKCQYMGKRESCRLVKGHETCGVSVNGHIPEGDIPKDLVERIRRAIPACKTNLT